jgi:hypothetical protein
VGYNLAQLNIGRMRAPLDSHEMADFMAGLDPINALADASPGFVWRLQTDEGNATSLRPFSDDDELIVNMSVWSSLSSLTDFVRGTEHRDFVRRRRDWFAPMQDEHLVLWWIPEGRRPTVDEATAKLERLRAEGPSPEAFTFRSPFPPPTDDGLDLRVSDAERQAVADLLRQQTTAGRLTLDEFEQRLDEAFGAQTGRQLQAALRELPVEPPKLAHLGPSTPSRSDEVSDDDLKRRHRLRLRGELSGFIVPNFLCNMIWIMGDHGYWWPGWVMAATGAGALTALAKGFDPDKERAELVAERRKAAIYQIEARHTQVKHHRQLDR